MSEKRIVEWFKEGRDRGISLGSTRCFERMSEILG
jgi:hypothetical protein